MNFTYDGNGNTHTIDNGSTLWTYNYDYNNRLTSVEDNSVTVATYSYDGNGMLVHSVEKDTESYAYNSGNRIYAKNTGSGSVVDYLYADGMVLASINGSTTDYFHEDALGSVRLETSSTATTLFSSDYRPYGPSYGATASVAFGYTGKPTDAATGLYYSEARWYDSASGRFMTQDPHTGQLAVPLSQNRYIYALDNPMTYVDRTGYAAGNSITTSSSSYSTSDVVLDIEDDGGDIMETEVMTVTITTVTTCQSDICTSATSVVSGTSYFLTVNGVQYSIPSQGSSGGPTIIVQGIDGPNGQPYTSSNGGNQLCLLNSSGALYLTGLTLSSWGGYQFGAQIYSAVNGGFGQIEGMPYGYPYPTDGPGLEGSLEVIGIGLVLIFYAYAESHPNTNPCLT